tara:strand:- start:105413 stop:106924 length:1512 start_codon:yes stop_codon:yes gene_type:complete
MVAFNPDLRRNIYLFTLTNPKLKMKTQVYYILLLIALDACQQVSREEIQQKPNVIVIITDDQGWGDIGYNNPNVYTPNMDKLAAGGATFVNHYSMPQCTPTRVALFTGRYPGRFGTNALQANNKPVFQKGVENLATLFKRSGYETFLCGKWHMGSNPEYGPNHYGFDESYGSLAGAVGMYNHKYRKGEFEMAWHRNHDTIPGHENGIHATDLVSQEAIRYISKEHTDPYFMYLAFHAPHTPLDERGKFVDRPTQLDPEDSTRWLNEDEIEWFNDPAGKIQAEPDPEKRLLLAAVYHVDYAIGEIVKAIEKTGQRENTLILFTSDNGPQVNWPGNAYPDDLHLTDFNQEIPMRGSKMDVWEGGIHVPGFANWPGHIPPKKVMDPVHVIDWLPTLAEIIGQGPGDTELDGVDISPALLGDNLIERRDFYWTWNSNINRWALRNGDWKIVKYGTGEPKDPGDWQLYNLANDPTETTDVAEANQPVRERLHQLFLAQRSKDKTSVEF